MRREIGAFVCLFLGIFTVLCCFHVNAVVLNLMASLFKGTIGAGFYILPFSFLLGFLILLLHDGRPVALRVTCAFLLAATIGALAHVFSGGSELEWSWEMFGELWDGGISGAGGGILCACRRTTARSNFRASICRLCRKPSSEPCATGTSIRGCSFPT